MKMSKMKSVLTRSVFLWVFCGVLGGTPSAQAQFSPPANGDMIGVLTSVSITNRTLSSVGTAIPIELRLWGNFMLTNTAVGPTVLPKLRMNLAAEEEAWSAIENETDLVRFTDGVGSKTKVTFTYRIREGDMVSKLKIAGSDGSDVFGVPYGFDWGTWKVVQLSNPSSNAVWRFRTGTPSYLELPGNDPTHYDFSYRSVSIKTIQFSSYPSPVQVGESVTWQVSTVNPVTTGRTVTCYAWVSNVVASGDININGVKAQQLSIPAGATTASFQITGLTEGTNTVYLQGTQDYGNNATKGVQNAEVRQIVVAPAPDPYVAALLPTAAAPYTSQTLSESSGLGAGTMRIRLSQTYTSDVWVRLDTALNGVANTNHVVFNTTPKYVRVRAGSQESDDIAFSVPDGTLDSESFGITVTPVITNALIAAHFIGETEPCLVKVANVAPVVTSPITGTTMIAKRGTPQRFTWSCSDVAADLSGMTVTWDFGDATSVVVTNGYFGEIYHTYTSNGSRTVKVYATDKEGQDSLLTSLTVTVEDPIPAPKLSLLFSTGTTNTATYAETQNPVTGWVRLVLSDSFYDAVQVKLTTLPNGQLNLLLGTTNTITIATGDLMSGEIPFSLLDGTADSSLNGVTLIPTILNVAASNYYTDVRQATVRVQNVAPVIIEPFGYATVAAASTNAAVSPYDAVPMGRAFAFDWTVDDVIADASGMIFSWDFGDGTQQSVTNGLIGRVYHTYASLGDKIVRLQVTDKDGGTTTRIAFKATVVSPPPDPTVYVRAPAGTLDESTSLGTATIDVELSEAFTNKVTVQLTVTPVSNASNGGILLATNTVYFNTGETFKTVTVSARDGTAISELTGFTITPTVIGTAAATAHFTELVSGIVQVRNAKPSIRTPVNSTTTTEISYTIPQGTGWDYYWDVDDVSGDLSTMSVTWYFGDGSEQTVTGASGKVTKTYTATGTMTVRVVALDKDSGRDEVVFRVQIMPVKNVIVTPIGPNLEANYWGAPGLGNGQVFSEDALGRINRNNTYFFTYGPSVSSAALRAVPYKTGISGTYTVTNYNDSGVAIPGALHEYDSFFYVWVGEDQGLPATDLLPAQAVPTTAVTLPTSTTGTDGTTTSVDIRLVQAIFSREYRKADNCGDINNDGIPDKIATYYNLPTLASTTTTTDGGTDTTEGTPVELKPVGNFNRDKDLDGVEVGDFLPGAASTGSGIIGGVSNVFATVGDPFSAFLEIRGFHLGLNSVQYNSDADFAPNELALGRDCERATDPTQEDTDGDGFPDGWEYYFWYNAKVNNMTGMAYTPTNVAVGTLIPSRAITTAFDPIVPATDVETGAAINRDLDNDGLSDIEELTIGTNPINWDTDGDGMCDGWEVLYGMNPNDSRDGLSVNLNNPDGDYMAIAIVTRQLVTLESGVQCLVPTNVALVVGDALGEQPSVTAFYHYGDDSAPIAQGRALPGLDAEIVASAITNDVILLHNQVMQEFGFDPRTAWGGTVNPLKSPQRFPEWVAGLTAERVITAPHTQAYSALDEYLLMKYMAELRLNGCDGSIGEGNSTEKTTEWSLFSTHPKTPDSDVVWGAGGGVAKSDRMPDGWELYVSFPVGFVMDTMMISPWDAYDGDWTLVDEDNLSNMREFHGVDSSSWYTNTAQYGGDYTVVSIVRPTSDQYWVNKFWTTDPYIGDTDGDGVLDSDETAFSYGTPVDNLTTCTPGGGLNPCSVDTDSDQLPDGWEQAFSGTLGTEGAATNGMDGTVSDYNQDWDHDGLLNHQEYWVQAVRSLRYDLLEVDAPMDGSAGPAALFTPVTNAWDFSMYPFGDDNPPLAILLPVGASELYVTCDPRDPDTDGDGMDDFYEMFHGLNPILGDLSLRKGDRIREAYIDGGAITITAFRNGWDTSRLPMDFVLYPWLAGLDEADVDADGLRNMEEQIQADSAAPSCSNTDPSPLWLTDYYSPESVTGRFYRFGGMFFWPGDNATLSQMSLLDYSLYSFEMNEGYDTDNDGVSDKAEMMQTATSQSDPQDHDDPQRRQALWFDGNASAAQGMYNVVSSNSYAFRSFTVELWARPERVDTEQVLIERPTIYSSSDLSTTGNVTRVNFRIGIKADGRVYAMFQNAGLHDQQTGVAMVLGRQLAANEWVHLVASMDSAASQLKLYINDETPISFGTSLIPANGVINLMTNPDGSQYPNPYRFTVESTVLVLGAANLNTFAGLEFPSWNRYANFYQGYLDEVRIWDGARTDTQILQDMKRRYTKDDLLANRTAVRESEYAGGSRKPGVSPQLPAELLYHFTFDNLFGADSAASVAKVPRGFNYWETAINRPLGYEVSWWKDLPTVSQVYTDYGYVPWIENGVTHLPIFGGMTAAGTNTVSLTADTVRNSIYWSHLSAGTLPTAASAHNLDQYSFPNSNDPYGLWYYTSLDFEFSDRAGLKTSSDLLPLGNAYAKQAVVMWDNDSPSSAWADTGDDSDADGLPDWWETYVATLGAAYANLGWYDLYPDNSGMTAGEKYMRDVALGYTESNHPTAPGWDESALIKQTSDIDGDGLPDWWENLYNLNSADATGANGASGDPDLDALNNFAEYQISEVYEIRSSRPDRFKTQSDQPVSDYFMRQGSLYMGEMFTDHDFMEDDWEAGYSAAFVNRYVYDAHLDTDQDGWSNWAESRYGASDQRCDPSSVMHLNIESESIKDFPIPIIETALTYTGNQIGGNLILQAYANAQMEGLPDAIWHIPSSDDGTASAYQRMLGFWGARKLNGVLSPGSIVPGTIGFTFTDTLPSPLISAAGTTWAASVRTVTVIVDVADSTPGVEARSGLLKASSAYGLMVDIGTINYLTGEFEINLALIDGWVTSEKTYSTAGVIATPQLNVNSSYIKVAYSAAQTMAWPKKLYLADADEPSTTVPSHGYVREGLNYFFAFVDSNGSGAWDAGEPCGVSDKQGVPIGYDRNLIQIELTDYTPGYLRMTFSPSARSEDIFNGGIADGGGGTVQSSGLNRRIVVRRRTVDNSTLYRAIVFDQVIDTPRGYIHDGDFKALGEYGLDWGLAGVPITIARQSAVYDVYYPNIGDLVTASTDLGTPALTFTNLFSSVRPKAVCKTPSNNGYVYSAQTTFTWSMPQSSTAFELELRRSSSTGPIVYQSGPQPAPARDKNGNCIWAAPIYAGKRMPNGQVYSPNQRYYWRISALSIPFPISSVLPNWSDWSSYRLDVNPPLDSAGYGAVKAVVKYFGPGTSLSDKVRIQMFNNAAFSGEPVAEYTLAGGGLTDLVDPTTANTNAVINGLTPSVEAGGYYACAYIDSNSNQARDAWESWGYANSYGTSTKPYDPLEITVAYVPLTESPTVNIFIQDVDTDQDWFPDVWEYEQNPSSTSFLALSGPGLGSDGDPDYEINPNLSSTTGFMSVFTTLMQSTSDMDADGVGDLMELVLGSDANASSTAGDGLSDSWKINVGLAPQDKVSLNLTALTMNNLDATLVWNLSVETADTSALTKSLTLPTKQPQYEVLFTASLDAPDWQVVATGTVALENASADEVNTSISRTQQALQATPVAGFFRIRLVE